MVLAWNPIKKAMEAWKYGREQGKWEDSAGNQVWVFLRDVA